MQWLQTIYCQNRASNKEVLRTSKNYLQCSNIPIKVDSRTLSQATIRATRKVKVAETITNTNSMTYKRKKRLTKASKTKIISLINNNNSKATRRKTSMESLDINNTNNNNTSRKTMDLLFLMMNKLFLLLEIIKENN